MTSLHFRQLRKGDEKGLSRVIGKVWGADHDSAYWDWKYHRNVSGDHMVTVALDGDKVIGVQGYTPGRLKCGENVYFSAQNTDMAVLPEYRGVGTLLKLHARAMEYGPQKKRALCYGFPNKTASRLAACLQYSIVCPICNLTKVLNPIAYLEKKIGLRGSGGFAAVVVRHIVFLLTKWRYADKNAYRIVRLGYFDERFDEFWARQQSKYPVAVVRDRGYLNWRYVECPSDYEILAVQDKHAVIRGFIVLTCSWEQGVRRGKIVDVLVEDGQKGVAELLIKGGLQYFVKNNVDVVTCWMFDHWPLFEILRKGGFVKREVPNYLVVNSEHVDLPAEYFRDTSKWYVTMGDSDYC